MAMTLRPRRALRAGSDAARSSCSSLAELAYFTGRRRRGLRAAALRHRTARVGDQAGAGLAFGAFAVSALLLRPFTGRLSDTRGRRPLLLGGAVLFAASSA